MLLVPMHVCVHILLLVVVYEHTTTTSSSSVVHLEYDVFQRPRAGEPLDLGDGDPGPGARVPQHHGDDLARVLGGDAVGAARRRAAEADHVGGAED